MNDLVGKWVPVKRYQFKSTARPFLGVTKMRRYTITEGAKTTSGGTVIQASSNGSINGARIAVEHDQIFCPACKSSGYILCIGPRLIELWNGKQTALENDLCICGCFPSPRLKSNQTLRSQVIGEEASNKKSSTSLAPPTAATSSSATDPKESQYNLVFEVTDDKTGTLLIDWPYSIELGNGEHLTGRTDHTGHTGTISSIQAEHAILRVFAPEPTPINPSWDH
ncbi:MAG: PAAR domain-containing protein [Pseudomonadota bacterium]